MTRAGRRPRPGRHSRPAPRPRAPYDQPRAVDQSDVDRPSRTARLAAATVASRWTRTRRRRPSGLEPERRRQSRTARADEADIVGGRSPLRRAAAIAPPTRARARGRTRSAAARARSLDQLAASDLPDPAPGAHETTSSRNSSASVGCDSPNASPLRPGARRPARAENRSPGRAPGPPLAVALDERHVGEAVDPVGAASRTSMRTPRAPAARSSSTCRRPPAGRGR